jgi:hypothetical protein
MLSREDRPPDPGPKHQILRVPPNSRIDFLCFSTAWEGYWMHWEGLRSSPCFRDRETCTGCERKKPRKWRGYVYGITLPGRDPYWLELTPGMAHQLLEQDSQKLRGRVIQCSRGNGKKATPTVICLQKYEEERMVKGVAPFSVLETLAKIWRVNLDLSREIFGNDEPDLGVVA